MTAAGFLDAAGWDGAQATPLAGDASARRYTRLRRKGDSAILMQDPDGDTGRFAALARHLQTIGLSAPRILAQAPGLLLLEDLGDGLLARLCTTPGTERMLYLVATDALIALHRHAPPDGLALADAAHLAQMTDLAFAHYANAMTAFGPVCDRLQTILRDHAGPSDVMILRDYHAENILWLPDRVGPARAGLLDFQDALAGPRAYDLVSLLHDIRRDVADDTIAACLDHFAEQTGQDRAALDAAFHALGVQRNLRILGVFARLAQRGKPRYLELLPRTWARLQQELAHPALAPLRPLIADALPPPDTAHLTALRQTCPTP